MAIRFDNFTGAGTRQVDGFQALANKINAIAKETGPKIVGQALRAAMKPMLAEARSNAPSGSKAHRTYKGRLVAPGYLKRNIKLKKLRRRDKSSVAYGLWSADEAWYGQLIEAGFKGEKARPWLGPAYESNKDKVAQLFEEAMEKKIVAAMKRIKSK